jgi:putative nucleotidyltransferase with HDIG domain
MKITMRRVSEFIRHIRNYKTSYNRSIFSFNWNNMENTFLAIAGSITAIKKYDPAARLVNCDILHAESKQSLIHLFNEHQIKIVLLINEENGALKGAIDWINEFHPETYIVVINGIKDFDVKYSGVAHRILPMSVNDEKLYRILKELSHINTMFLSANLVRKINSLGPIPMLPEIYIRLEREINKPIVSNNRISEIISSDPLIVAKILHIAHSAFFNMPEGMMDLTHAVNLLGINILKTIVLHTKIFTLKDVSEEMKVILKKVSKHSLDVAKLSKQIMESENKSRSDIELAYIAGLLHDIGKILLLKMADSNKDTKYFDALNNPNLMDFEVEVFGVSHVDIGIYILSLWGFHESILRAIADHHKIDSSAEIGINESVAIANVISHGHHSVIEKLKTLYEEKVNIWIDLK